MQDTRKTIINGDIYIGIELGSTRIKAVVINQSGTILATGGFNWENQLVDDIWTYSLTDIWQGLQQAYADLTKNIKDKYACDICTAKAIGISGMMHGYMPFDKHENLLVPFRTWRNNITAQACKILIPLFKFNIPQRWSIAHLYQSILNNEHHVQDINFLTTVAGYVHWQLTGEKVIGIGEASGMFPIDTQTQNYDENMLNNFNQHIEKRNLSWKLPEILPRVLIAGQNAGKLTPKGAQLLDPTGKLQAGIPFCPPEGDAGTGMVATNSLKESTGNISAGTSAFAMIVLEQSLSKVYDELDIVMTPTGKTVAMAHANNCTSDINAWVGLFKECLAEFGVPCDNNMIYEKLFYKALQGDNDCGGLLSYGFYSGEHAVGLSEGCPLFIHPTQSNFNMANFMRVHIYSAFAAMKLGMDILLQEEKIKITKILAHGGIFKTQQVAQSILASAINVPIATMNTAGEGGAWGMALLASYLDIQQELSLEQYLEQKIFYNVPVQLIEPNFDVNQGYHQFMNRYLQTIPAVQTAIDNLAHKDSNSIQEK